MPHPALRPFAFLPSDLRQNLVPVLAGALLCAGLAGPTLADAPRRNVVLFVADGLRPGMVNADTAPTMTLMALDGVAFLNTHSLFPTFTMANGSAMATGHYLGDTGIFSNTLWAGLGVAAAHGSPTPFIENDAVLGELDHDFSNDFVDEETVLAAARAAGLSTAAIGKVGPALLQDHTARDGQTTVVIDDATGGPAGIPLNDAVKQGLQAAGLPLTAPTRGPNGQSGTAAQPGTAVANVAQQQFFADAATKVVLPLFAHAGKPFALVFWSRDPDGTQHNQGDSLGQLVPGINGPTSLAAIRNADHDLAQLLSALRDLGLAANTDVVVASDHGFSTISKQSHTSFAAGQHYAGVPAGLLPRGFVAIDLAHGLGTKLFDPDAAELEVVAGAYPSFGNGLVGDPLAPQVIVAANGGSDLVYIPGHDRKILDRALAVLSAEDYVSGLFVDDSFGPVPGTLPLSSIALKGHARTPTPAIAVNFASFALGCDEPTTCGAEVADTALQQGQGMHGGFGREDTRSTLIAQGIDFRRGYRDRLPASNADVGKTLLRLLGLTVRDQGHLVGRVLDEALTQGQPVPAWGHAEIVSQPDAAGHVTVLRQQTIGGTPYFDAAGYPGRTLGVPGTEVPFNAMQGD